MSCKLYLVPEDIIQNWKMDNRNHQVDNPMQYTVDKLDEKMQNILKNPDLNEYDKERLYSQKLGEYVTMRDKQHQPSQQQQPQPFNEWSNYTLSTIPKKFQTKAKALMSYMQSDDDIKWDNLDQLVLKDKVIPQSNIVDLLHDSLRARKKAKRPKGWRELSKHLRSKNIAEEIIGNDEWKKEKIDEESTSADVQQEKRKIEKHSQDWKTPPNSPNSSFFSPRLRSILHSEKDRKSKIQARQRIKNWIHLNK